MIYKTINLEIDTHQVARLTLNRPQKHNALSSEMIGEVQQACDYLKYLLNIRCLVITGAGDSFCAGADLEWMQQQFSASRGERIFEARALAHMLKSVNDLPFPVIARVAGQAYGGGLGLMSVCDHVIAIDAAMFGFTEVKLGLIPATIAPYVLARMGEAKARQYFFSGEVFDCQTAEKIGLVSECVSEAELEQRVEYHIQLYLKAEPAAVARAKKLIFKIIPPVTDRQIETTIHELADVWETAEAKKGVELFFAKKKAYL